jgi:hypothetical protein
VTGAVTTGGYHWPVTSLGFLGLHGRLWIYLTLVALT